MSIFYRPAAARSSAAMAALAGGLGEV
ncbi:MAG: hypothetical protein ACJAVS_000688, partial [Paracoccaceae bacterium]